MGQRKALYRMTPRIAVAHQSISFRSTESPAIALQQTRFRGYKLFFENESATESMIRAIEDFPFDVTPEKTEPTVIDCGANIGVSVLEFKSRWPSARVICFEPDPDAFRLLEMNIERNGVPNVQCIEAAVWDTEGRVRLFGELGHGADSRGNSIQASWGDRPGSSSVEVACKRLSKYLTEPVALLKLDVEGAEERVLRESFDCLHRVDALHVEVHETDLLKHENSLASITELMSAARFTLDEAPRYEPHALPPQWDSWRRQVGAR